MMVYVFRECLGSGLIIIADPHTFSFQIPTIQGDHPRGASWPHLCPLDLYLIKLMILNQVFTNSIMFWRFPPSRRAWTQNQTIWVLLTELLRVVCCTLAYLNHMPKSTLSQLDVACNDSYNRWCNLTSTFPILFVHDLYQAHSLTLPFQSNFSPSSKCVFTFPVKSK